MVLPGSWQAEAWEDWLKNRGLPGLRNLNIRSSDATGAGFDLPWRSPPDPSDRITTGIALNWAAWAVERMEGRHAVA